MNPFDILDMPLDLWQSLTMIAATFVGIGLVLWLNHESAARAQREDETPGKWNPHRRHAHPSKQRADSGR